MVAADNKAPAIAKFFVQQKSVKKTNHNYVNNELVFDSIFEDETIAFFQPSTFTYRKCASLSLAFCVKSIVPLVTTVIVQSNGFRYYLLVASWELLQLLQMELASTERRQILHLVITVLGITLAGGGKVGFEVGFRRLLLSLTE